MDLNRLEKINLEKRRRHQVYTTLDYLVSGVTYFDFFSTDAFEIAENSKYLGQICNKKQVTSEILLLSFFYILGIGSSSNIAGLEDILYQFILSILLFNMVITFGFSDNKAQLSLSKLILSNSTKSELADNISQSIVE